MLRSRVISLESLSSDVVDPRQGSDPLVGLIQQQEEEVDDIRRARFRRGLERLPFLEARVLCWSYGLGDEEPLSDIEIATRLNRTRHGVWEMRRRALDCLRADKELKELQAA